MPRQKPTLEQNLERFWANTEPDRTPDSSCVVWTKAKDKAGYGRFKVDGRLWYSHVWICEQVLRDGERTPEGWEWDHNCHNTSCQNTGHLEMVTKAENNMRRMGYGTS